MHRGGQPFEYILLEGGANDAAYDGKIDQLETKRDMIHLAPAGTYETGFSITIK